jgi:ketosteroid isomerase-like protein
MSEGNEEIIRRSFEAWNRDDWDALESFYDPAVEGVGPKEWPETGILEGYEAVRAQFTRNKDSWEEEHVEIDEIRETRPELVLARIRWVTKGKESGIPFESPVTILFRLRRGRIVRLEYYFDHADALEAAGASG